MLSTYLTIFNAKIQIISIQPTKMALFSLDDVYNVNDNVIVN